MSSHQYAELPQVKPLVTLSGTAKEGAIGPTLGLIDIGESEYAYLFQVSLPGVRDKGLFFYNFMFDNRLWFRHSNG